MGSSLRRSFNLSAKKRAFLETMLQGEGNELAQRITARAVDAPPPLSPAQQRLWFLDQLVPNSSLYNLPIALRMVGVLDMGALRRSLATIIQRHEPLRTTFGAGTDGQPIQVVGSARALPIALFDITTLPVGEREAVTQQVVLAQARLPFDLIRGPLIRAVIVRIHPTEQVLMLAMHHIISDGWSLDVLFRELDACYRAFQAGVPVSLAPLPIQYADYACWQRQQMHGGLIQRQRAYWQQQLRGAPALLALPTDHPRPAIQTYQGAIHSITVPEGLRAALVALNRQQGTTLFMVLLAAFQVLLSRYSGQQDVSVGTPIAGRTRAEVEGLIGFFVNTLVLRCDLSGDPTFQVVLSRVREVCLQAYAHQDLPFEQLVEELHPERNLSFNPLFQVLFALQDSPVEMTSLGDLAVSRYPVDSGTAKVDVALLMTNNEQGLRGSLTYNVALFDAATMARMARHFQALLECIVAAPERRVSQLSFLTSDERCQLLTVWNDTTAVFPADRCLHTLMAEQAARTPDAVALLFDGPMDEGVCAGGWDSHGFQGQVTYRELDVRANQLAHLFRSLGVGPDVRVALCMERSIAALVGLVGTLKAGGVYVPIDPSYPVDRQMFMIADVQAAVVLTTTAYAQRMSDVLMTNDAWSGPAVVCLDEVWEGLSAYPTQAPVCATTPDHLAYVIYTSGSTGTPKGVLVPHRGIVNLLTSRQMRCQLGADDCLLQHMPSAFDPSVWELCAALVVGARLVIARPGGPIDPTYLAGVIAEQQVSVLQLVPSVLNMLVEEPAFARCRALRTLFCGGEALTAELRVRTGACVTADIHHLYGPTETSIDATAWLCPQGDAQEGIAPIGFPIANMVVYLLDSAMQPVPVGVPGELYIGGVGVARGYHARPDLTAERFVPNSFVDAGSAQERRYPAALRLYRSGDLARYLPNGAIMFLGRIDQQVKVRGYRIELGEIEAMLLRFPMIGAAAVVVREDRPGDRRLVAYVVLQEEGAQVVGGEMRGLSSSQVGLDVGALRAFLKERLPSYMVPSAFVTLAAFPLTPHGKLDYRVLPVPEGVEAELDVVAPRNDVEAGVADIWAALLGQKRVGIYDNFFDLGGHSLLATQLILRVREMFQVVLPLRVLFDTPTVAGFAQAIESLRQSSSDQANTDPDLIAEAVLDPAIVPEGSSPGLLSDPQTIFMTGASGFLGAFLLYELLEQTHADVHCLMRAANLLEGRRRLQRHLEGYNLWDDAYAERLFPVVGDLAQPLLGLTPEQFAALAGMVDVIYHNGALVNFIYPYAALKPTNVVGTQEVLRLACMVKAKPLHYVSTLSVFSSHSCTHETVIHETDEPEQSEGLYSGYAQSKWVADRLVRIARDRGLPVCIYRPAAVTGHSQTGLAHPDDFTSRLLKGCIQLGRARDYERQMFLTPVDYVSKSIVFLSRQPESVGRAFHMINQRPMRWLDLIAWIRSFGYPMRLCSFEEWRTALSASAQLSHENALYPFVPMFFDDRTAAIERANRHRFLQFDCASSITTLEAAGIVCPPVDSQMLQTCFTYFIRSGFLAPPHEGAVQVLGT